ncbi:Wilms tumor protein homolog [Argiope bruennichi]|uniref:Wilms tumor protein homolog n=1 Tax=Argiope bruennichi TaxID=94029 RepID=UPI002495346C|nr:Wilms tumor protein homolog [Argiope bruennichi]
MSLLLHPMFETNALEPNLHKFNGIYDRTNLFSSETVRTSAFSDFRTLNSSRISTYFWEKDYSNISSEFAKPVSRHYENFFTKTNVCQNLWIHQEIQRPVVDYPAYSSKTTELWRPFSPPPRDEACSFQKSCMFENQSTSNKPPVIIPSSVKIGPSSSSVFRSVKKKKYTCLNCSTVFSNSMQLKSHLRKHKGVKPYKCEYPNCLKHFARNEELTRHRRIHSGYKPYHCNVCGKSFCRKDHLSKHLKTHLQISEKKIYVCCVPGCEHSYTRSDALTRHKTTAHSNLKNDMDFKMESK